MASDSKIIDKISALRTRYYEAHGDKQSLLKILSETEVADQVYNSNAIENSTLTLEETEKLLMQIELDRYLTEREMFEAKNLARVIEYIEKIAPEREISVDVMLLLHKMLITNIRDAIAGRFRSDNEWVKVGNHLAPNPKFVPELIDKLLINYFSDTKSSIVTRLARFHLEFENIHPFVDGNGRIGRVLNNYLLIRSGYVPINIKFIDRVLYYQAFSDYSANGSIDVMQDIVAKALTNSYHKRLAYMEGKKIVSLPEYAKLTNSSPSNIANKANRQTIEAFLEKGVWKIGYETTKK